MNGHIPTSHFEFSKFAMLIFDVMDGFTTVIYFFCGEILPFCEFFLKYIYIMLQIIYFKKSPKIVTQLSAIGKSV
jgi:hypothetical protein